MNAGRARARVRDAAFGADDRKGGKRGSLALPAPHKVNYGNGMSEQVVGHDPPVTAPPDGLRAHDRAGLARDHPEQAAQAFFERSGLRIVGVVVEGRALPAGVRVFRDALALAAAATERGEMDVAYPCGVQGLREHIDVELRVRSRPREAADVDEASHADLTQGIDELADRSR